MEMVDVIEEIDDVESSELDWLWLSCLLFFLLYFIPVQHEQFVIVKI